MESFNFLNKIVHVTCSMVNKERKKEMYTALRKYNMHFDTLILAVFLNRVCMSGRMFTFSNFGAFPVVSVVKKVASF